MDDGVLGAGGQQYAGLQDYEVEAFKGLDLIFIHNHPNGSDASEADLRAAFAAGAETLMVVTPQGYEYVHIRGADRMIPVRAEEASYEVAHGHLSVIRSHIQPKVIIGNRDSAIIGETGNTGLVNPRPDIEHFNQHLDLAIVYYGSKIPGEMEKAVQTYRSDPDFVHFFFGYAQRSTLSQNNDSRLYGENIDPERIPGLFYVSTESSG